MKITLELLQALCPKTKQAVLVQYVDALNDVAEYYDMYDNPRRVAGFLAQVAHESGGFNFVKENLNYGAKGLMTTFKKYFPSEELAKQYERQPEKIANRVYANRMANGDESSGDGYRFCGRGLIQLTGRANYTKFAQDLGISIEETVQYLETPAGAVSSAGWFWDNNNLNQYCDSDDFVTLTKRINGGTIGLEDRQHHYHLAIQLLQKQG
jgi:putative chitinase